MTNPFAVSANPEKTRAPTGNAEAGNAEAGDAAATGSDPGKNEARTLLLFSCYDDGHRGSYIKFLGTLFSTRRAGMRQVLSSPEPVLFLMIEECFNFYFFASLWRALRGRRTAGLMMRPKPARYGMSARLRIKRLMLRILRKIPAARTLTIVPFAVEPAFADIADGWLYDPQLWDMEDADHARYAALRAGEEEGAALLRAVRGAAGGRSVLSSIGIQSQPKGFDLFARACDGHEALRRDFFFAFGGQVEPALRPMAGRLAAYGAFGADRFISDEEILAFYAASDLIWCFYDPEYDQASGILGRAVQFGLPVLVREGALIQRFCGKEGIPCLVADREGVAECLSAFRPAADHEAGRARARRFRQKSLETLAWLTG